MHRREKKKRKTYCQAAEEVFDGLLSDIIGQVAKEGCVGGAAGQLRPVDVGFTGRPRSGGQSGAVDGWSSVAVLLGVPGGGHCEWEKEREIKHCA